MPVSARQFVARYPEFTRFLVALRSPTASVVKGAVDAMQALTGATDVEVQRLILTGANHGNADAASFYLFGLYKQIADAAKDEAARSAPPADAVVRRRKGHLER